MNNLFVNHHLDLRIIWLISKSLLWKINGWIFKCCSDCILCWNLRLHQLNLPKLGLLGPASSDFMLIDESARLDPSNRCHILKDQPTSSNLKTLKNPLQVDSFPLNWPLQRRRRNDFHKKHHCRTWKSVERQSILNYKKIRWESS